MSPHELELRRIDLSAAALLGPAQARVHHLEIASLVNAAEEELQ
jgi:hypothetical protein